MSKQFKPKLITSLSIKRKNRVVSLMNKPLKPNIYNTADKEVEQGSKQKLRLTSNYFPG